jgi:hypothetical protein
MCQCSEPFTHSCWHQIKVYVQTTFFRGHAAPVCCISPKDNDTFPISAAKDEVKVWAHIGHLGGQGMFMHFQWSLLIFYCIVESWELKAKLGSPNMFDHY